MHRSIRSSLRSTIVASLSLLTVMSALATPAQAVQPLHSMVVSADPLDITPNIRDGEVNAVIEMGNTVIVGGTFTSVQEANHSLIQTRNFLFSYDVTTGRVSQTFVPQLNDEVEALAPGPDGQSVFAGGAFGTVNGLSYKKVVRLNLSDGSVVGGFKANANSLVQDLAFNNGWLYMAGKFTLIGGSTSRSGLARLDPNTGAVDPNFNIPFANPAVGALGVPNIDVSSDGSKLVAAGNFGTVGGQPRSQLAVLDLSSNPPAVSSWSEDLTPVFNPQNPTARYCSGSFPQYTRNIDISQDGSYFVLVTTGAFRANTLCDTISRWDLTLTGPHQVPVWVDWTGGDTTYGVAITGPVIYVGGHFRWLNNPYRGDAAGPGALSREGIGALDPVNGLPLSWNPGRDRGIGTFALVGTPDGLYVGSDTDHCGGEFHQKLCAFPLTGGETIPSNVPYTFPNDLFNMSTSVTGNGNLTRRSFDGLSALGAASNLATPGVDWRNARGAFALNGKLYTGWSDGTFQVRTFDGTAVGPATTVGLNGLEVQPPSGFNIPSTQEPGTYIPGTVADGTPTTRIPAFTIDLAAMTGMFFDNGKIFYTVNRTPNNSANQINNNKLYYRYFTPESQVLGARLFVASTGDGVPWSTIAGMTMTGGRLYYATTDGRLWRVGFVGKRPSGTPVQIGGPTMDGVNYASRGMFAFTQSADSFPPSVPGKPAGTSGSFSTIDLTWGASSDNLSSSITYRIYRDGDTTPVGQVTSSSTTTVGFTDTGLAAGSTHTYQVDAVDGANNASAKSQASDSITVLAPDTTPPTDPGTPIGVSNGTSTIDLSWAASTDNEDTTLTYRIYRDDPTNQVGQVTSSSTTTVNFQDSGLWPGSSHTYWVDAVDTAGNPSNKTSSAPVLVQSAIFADNFSSGDLSNWSSVTRITIDGAIGSSAAPSALGSPTSQSAFANKDLTTPVVGTSCLSLNVNAASFGGTSVDLFRLRTAAGGAIVKVYTDASGQLFVRSDFSGTQFAPGATLAAGWNRVELCGTAGSSSAWDLYLNGTRVVNGWAADTGTTPVGRVQIGDTGSKTWTIHFDDVILDQAAG